MTSATTAAADQLTAFCSIPGACPLFAGKLCRRPTPNPVVVAAVPRPGFGRSLKTGASSPNWSPGLLDAEHRPKPVVYTRLLGVG